MRLRTYRDPIYGYIDFTDRDDSDPKSTAFEADLIHHPCIQRLHQISQMHSAWIRYPSARHSRFSHALGVMQLAGEFARSVYTSFFYERCTVSENSKLPSIEAVVETFRIAGLLHDCGHGPFSHIFETVVLEPRFHLTHESVGGLLAQELLGDIIFAIHHSPAGAFEEEIRPELVRFLIDPPEDDGEARRALAAGSALAQVCCQLGWILNWRFANADTLDYLMRDAYHCGTPEYQGVDSQRIMRSIELHPGVDGAINVSLDVEKSATAIISYLSSRMYMYSAVYFHEDVRSLDFELEEVLRSIIDTIDLPNPASGKAALETYCTLTDASMSPSLLTHHVASPDQHGEVAKIQHAWLRYARGPARWHKLLDIAGTASVEISAIDQAITARIFDAADQFFKELGQKDARVRLDHQVRDILPALGVPPSGSRLLNSRDVTRQICWQLPSNLVISRLYGTVNLSDSLRRKLRIRLDRELTETLRKAGVRFYSR